MLYEPFWYDSVTVQADESADNPPCLCSLDMVTVRIGLSRPDPRNRKKEATGDEHSEKFKQELGLWVCLVKTSLLSKELKKEGAGYIVISKSI